MRPLQTCRKYHIITEYGGNKIHHPVGAVIDRPRSHPGNATYRVNRTGRIYASPTNLPEIYIFPNYCLLSGYS